MLLSWEISLCIICKYHTCDITVHNDFLCCMDFSYNIHDERSKVALTYSKSEFVSWHIAFITKNYVVLKHIMHCDVTSMIFVYCSKWNFLRKKQNNELLKSKLPTHFTLSSHWAIKHRGENSLHKHLIYFYILRSVNTNIWMHSPNYRYDMKFGQRGGNVFATPSSWSKFDVIGTSIVYSMTLYLYILKPLTDEQVFYEKFFWQYTAAQRTIGLNLLRKVFFVDRTDGQDFALPIFSTTSALVQKLAW